MNSLLSCTAKNVCRGFTEREESLALARQIATSNGYKYHVSNLKPHRELLPKICGSSYVGKVTSCLPFLSDKVSAAIRKRLRRTALEDNVAVVEAQPNKLKREFVRNRMYDRICATPKCIIRPTGRAEWVRESLLVSCVSCGEEYIDETARPLRARIKEQKPNHSSRYTQKVLTRLSSEVSIEILAQKQTAAHKTWEALWVQEKIRKCKEECLSITRELAPYLGLPF